MVCVNFKTKGTLEIPAEFSFIHPLEATTNYASTGPQFALGERITTLDTQPIPGVVHGFITPLNGSLIVLIWFNETDKYQQLRPDQIQSATTNPPLTPPQAPPTGKHNTGQTCLSGCSLLASPLGGVPMRELRPGTRLINGRESGESHECLLQYGKLRDGPDFQTLSYICTPPIAKGTGRTPSAESAAEWHTRRRADTYRSKPMDTPLHRPFAPPVSQYLHASSPKNLRKSSDLWGFSTENNQAVRSFDDPHCLICPIGHKG